MLKYHNRDKIPKIKPLQRAIGNLTTRHLDGDTCRTEKGIGKLIPFIFALFHRFVAFLTSSVSDKVFPDFNTKVALFVTFLVKLTPVEYNGGQLYITLKFSQK